MTKKQEVLEEVGTVLTPLQIRFCEEYLIDLNGTKAAIRAGYKKKSAASQASRLLTNDKIAQYILELMNKRSAETGIKASDVINELGSIAFSNLKKIAEWDADGKLTVKTSDEMTMQEAAAIESIKVTRVTNKGDDLIHSTTQIKLHRKAPALLLLMRHLGLLGDQKVDEENPILKRAMADIYRDRG